MRKLVKVCDPPHCLFENRYTTARAKLDAQEAAMRSFTSPTARNVGGGTQAMVEARKSRIRHVIRH